MAEKVEQYDLYIKNGCRGEARGKPEIRMLPLLLPYGRILS